VVAQVRGATFIVSQDGWLIPALGESHQIALNALICMAEATGFPSSNAYVHAVIEEGPAFLRRLPGVTP
jgi:hypothetical protein